MVLGFQKGTDFSSCEYEGSLANESAEASASKQQDVPFPIAHVPRLEVESQLLRAYEHQAQSAGFYPIELTRLKLIEFFETMHIGIWNYEDVSAWYQSKRVDKRISLSWLSLRQKDALFLNSSEQRRVWWEHVVPVSILEKVRMIESVFGESVKFLVTDCETSSGTRFVMVQPSSQSKANEDFFIFGFWNDSDRMVDMIK